MKLLKKLGVVFTSFALSMKALVMKVHAVSGFDIEAVCDYGVVTPQPEPTIATNIVSTIIVPIILLIGLIVFLVKSTSSVLKKVIVSVGVVVVYIIFRIIMNLI